MSRTLVFAALVLGLALAEFIYPFGPRTLRISPGLLVILALLLALRDAVRRQARKREEILKAVPRRPLGLSDDSPEGSFSQRDRG